jgi:hypothetical protein
MTPTTWKNPNPNDLFTIRLMRGNYFVNEYMSEQELSTYMDFIRLIEDMNTINSIKNRKNNNTHYLSSQSFTDDIEEDPAEISTTASTGMSSRHILEYNIITITDMTPTTFNNNNHHKSLQGYTLPDLTKVNIINLTVMNLRLSHDSGHQPLHANTDIILMHCLVEAKISIEAQSQIFDRGHPHPQERRNTIRMPLLLLLITTAIKGQFIEIHPICLPYLISSPTMTNGTHGVWKLG